MEWDSHGVLVQLETAKSREPLPSLHSTINTTPPWWVHTRELRRLRWPQGQIMDTSERWNGRHLESQGSSWPFRYWKPALLRVPLPPPLPVTFLPVSAAAVPSSSKNTATYYFCNSTVELVPPWAQHHACYTAGRLTNKWTSTCCSLINSNTNNKTSRFFSGNCWENKKTIYNIWLHFLA